MRIVMVLTASPGPPLRPALARAQLATGQQQAGTGDHAIWTCGQRVTAVSPCSPSAFRTPQMSLSSPLLEIVGNAQPKDPCTLGS